MMAVAGCGNDGEVTRDELHRIDERIAGVHVKVAQNEVLSGNGRKLMLGTAKARGERLSFVVDANPGQQGRIRAVGETFHHAGGCAGAALYLGEGADRYPYTYAVDRAVFGLAPDADCEL